MTRPGYQCWTKATDAEEGPPRYSANWVVARRARFRAFPDRVECGDWTIPASAVRDAVLYRVQQGLLPGYVLSVQTDARTYQFGFNPWVRVADHLPFAFRRERARLGYSGFSVALRVVLVAFLAYNLWRLVTGRASP